MAMHPASTYERKMNLMIMNGNEAGPQPGFDRYGMKRVAADNLQDPMPSRSVEGS
jgi:hypothetical protein